LKETESKNIEELYPYAKELLDDLLQEHIEEVAGNLVQEETHSGTPSDTSSSPTETSYTGSPKTSESEIASLATSMS
jgi:hypothetical protein